MFYFYAIINCNECSRHWCCDIWARGRLWSTPSVNTSGEFQKHILNLDTKVHSVSRLTQVDSRKYLDQVRFSDPFTTKWVKKNLSFPESTESTQVLLHSSQKIWLTLSKTSTLVGTTKPPNFLTIPHFPSSTSVNMWISSTTDWLGDRFVWIHVTKKERPILSHHFTIPQPMTLRIGWYYIVVWMNGEYKVMDKCRISTTRRSISWPTSVGLTLIWGVPPSCPAAQPVLPIPHQAEPGRG